VGSTHRFRAFFLKLIIVFACWTRKAKRLLGMVFVLATRWSCDRIAAFLALGKGVEPGACRSLRHPQIEPLR
jgi:hypothetical protein